MKYTQSELEQINKAQAQQYRELLDSAAKAAEDNDPHLVVSIYDQLDRLNVQVYDALYGTTSKITADDDFLSAVSILPRCNQEAIMSYLQDIPEPETGAVLHLHEIIDRLQKAGLMSFTPFIYTDSHGSSLVLKYNWYLHNFCNYYYQVSYSHLGIGERQHAPWRLDHAIRAIKHVCSGSGRDYAIAYLHYANLLCSITDTTQFRKLMRSELDKYKSLSLFTMLVENSIKHVSVPPYELFIRENIIRVLGDVDMDGGQMYYIPDKEHKNRSLARIYSSVNTTTIELCDRDSGRVFYTLRHIPGLDISELTVEELNLLNTIYISTLLSYFHFHIDNHFCYPQSKALVSFTSSIDSNCVELTSLQDIVEFEDM